ncbi:hypothetical protein E2542_SST08767 [Spatholobus suberectus]|nr:hypothetical protein E2542_SST08767 [Spatholobus suberectus]
MLVRQMTMNADEMVLTAEERAKPSPYVRGPFHNRYIQPNKPKEWAQTFTPLVSFPFAEPGDRNPQIPVRSIRTFPSKQMKERRSSLLWFLWSKREDGAKKGLCRNAPSMDSSLDILGRLLEVMAFGLISSHVVVSTSLEFASSINNISS